MIDNDPIPCTDELNRLKDFLADFKTPTQRYENALEELRQFYGNRPLPYSVEELQKTPYERPVELEIEKAVASEIKKIERAKADANFWSWYDY